MQLTPAALNHPPYLHHECFTKYSITYRVFVSIGVQFWMRKRTGVTLLCLHFIERNTFCTGQPAEPTDYSQSHAHSVTPLPGAKQQQLSSMMVTSHLTATSLSLHDVRDDYVTEPPFRRRPAGFRARVARFSPETEQGTPPARPREFHTVVTTPVHYETSAGHSPTWCVWSLVFIDFV